MINSNKKEAIVNSNHKSNNSISNNYQSANNSKVIGGYNFQTINNNYNTNANTNQVNFDKYDKCFKIYAKEDKYKNYPLKKISSNNNLILERKVNVTPELNISIQKNLLQNYWKKLTKEDKSKKNNIKKVLNNSNRSGKTNLAKKVSELNQQKLKAFVDLNKKKRIFL